MITESNLIPTRVETADVLVVGAGMAGLMAAIKAKDENNDVIIVDKATPGKTGASTFAAGNMLCWLPNQPPTIEEWVEVLSHSGTYLNDPDWTEGVIRDSYLILNEMKSWGIPFTVDERGEFVRSWGRGKISFSATFHGIKLMRLLAARARGVGVRIFTRTMVTDLLTYEGRVVGAVGFNIRSGEFQVFKAKATVLATGGSTYKGPYFGQHMDCGEGYRMAFDTGGELANMELGLHYNTGHKEINIYGMSRFQGLGGRFLNALGEDFMALYDPELGPKANHDLLSQAMAVENLQGRGPVFLDAAGMSSQHQAFMRQVDPLAITVLERIGVKPFQDKMEWVPSLTGTIGSASGILVGRNYLTSVRGLFACGDASSKTGFRGSDAGSTGHALGYACYSGYRCGQHAQAMARESPEPVMDEGRIAALKARAYSFMSGKGRVSLDEAIFRLQEAVIPAKYSIIRHEERMKEALKIILEVKEEMVPQLKAADFHELVTCHELESMGLTAELSFRSALERKESRGFQFREDYPVTTKEGLYWTIARRGAKGGISLSRLPVEVEKFKARGIEIKLPRDLTPARMKKS